MKNYTVDKDGNKHYRMKMETGYLNTRGYEMFGKKQEGAPAGQVPQFSFIQPATPNMTKILIKVPGFTQFGLKKLQITEVKTGEVVFTGAAFTIFGTTRCRISRQANKRIITGEKYKITIQK